MSNVKEKQGKERSEKKEVKRKKRKERKEKKEVKRDPHIKGYGSHIFKSRSRSTVKRSWSETWRDCRKL